MRIALLVFLLIVLISSPVRAQQSLFEKKGQKDFSKAVLYEMHHQYDKAIQYYERSIRKSPDQSMAYEALAKLYRVQQNFKDAAKTLNRCTSCSATSRLTLAEDFFKSGDYNKALQTLDQLPGGLPKSDDAKRKLLEEDIRLATNLQSSNRIPDSSEIPKNLGERINSVFDEFSPSINLDDSVMVFTRKTNGVDQDFYLAHRDSCGGWLEARPLGSPPNSPSQEGSQMLSADGHYLFFTRCENTSPDGWAYGGCDLYFSYDVPGGWSQPIPFGPTINTTAYEGMPSLSPDNKVLYFVSDRPGGYGGKDIWMSRFEDGLWQIPENLGPEINTAGDETAPWIAADNQTLYFTSNGHPGLGGNDLYLSRKGAGGKWGKPIDLGYPINSPSDDVSMNVTNDGQKAYFASNRAGGTGGMDIYEVRLPEALQPQPRTFVYGIVKDSISGHRLPLSVLTWTNVRTGDTLAQYESNRGDASFISPFPVNTELALEVSRYGYLDVTDTFCFRSQKVFPPDTLNIALLPFNYQPPLTDTNLLTVYFGKNSFSLDDSSIQRIKKVIAPFEAGSYNTFFVNGFTDTTGLSSINEDISQRRAHSVGEILLQMGVPADKIQEQGWSDSSPVGSNETETGRSLNRRAVLVLRRPER